MTEIRYGARSGARARVQYVEYNVGLHINAVGVGLFVISFWRNNKTNRVPTRSRRGYIKSNDDNTDTTAGGRNFFSRPYRPTLALARVVSYGTYRGRVVVVDCCGS